VHYCVWSYLLINELNNNTIKAHCLSAALKTKNKASHWLASCKSMSCLLLRDVVCLSSVTRVYCRQTVGWINMKFGVVVGLGPRHIVLDGDPALPPKGHSPSPQFLTHVRCGQTAWWIKMPLGMEVGLGPSDIVLDADPAPPQKGAQPHPPPPKFKSNATVGFLCDSWALVTS